MRVYTRTHKQGDRGMTRVVNALEQHAPHGIEIVDNYEDADLVILHAIGRLERLTRMAEWCKDQGKAYAIIQYAIRSTKTKKTEQWKELWEDAAIVWSYYDLFELCAEDKTRLHMWFYHAPLGTDFEYNVPTPAKYMIATSGLAYTAESVRECFHASKHTTKPIFHVGPDIGHGIECSNGMSDEELMKKYAQCKFVSGLRRVEGFEFPVIEGLMCGAKPICFDQPHYKHWFHDLATFIPEGSREEVIESLKSLFRAGPYPPVQEKDKQTVRERFNWSTIIQNFYNAL